MGIGRSPAELLSHGLNRVTRTVVLFLENSGARATESVVRQKVYRRSVLFEN